MTWTSLPWMDDPKVERPHEYERQDCDRYVGIGERQQDAFAAALDLRRDGRPVSAWP